jgi:hypothetical protein
VQTQIAEREETLEEKSNYGLGKENPAAARLEVDRALLRRLKRRAETSSKFSHGFVRARMYLQAMWEANPPGTQTSVAGAAAASQVNRELDEVAGSQAR